MWWIINIAKNDSKKGLRCLTHFVRRNSNTDFIITDALFRFDLAPFSYVNAEVRLFNKRLQILMNISTHVHIFNTSTNRDHYTTHGLHMNNFGKNWISNHLVTVISKIFLSDSNHSPVLMNWKDAKASHTSDVNLLYYIVR
jgi:hypothetical protein